MTLVVVDDTEIAKIYYPITPHISTPTYNQICLYLGHTHMVLISVDNYQSVTKSLRFKIHVKGQIYVKFFVKGKKSILVELRRNVGIEPVAIGRVLMRKSLINQHYPCALRKSIKQPFGHFQDNCSRQGVSSKTEKGGI